MNSSAKILICVVGPTAIGKTAMAIEMALHYNCEIISADSRQFYREMSIGTAVPSEIELQTVKHHFIHNLSIADEYSVGKFEKEALTKLDELFLVSDYAILVGGSGLYVDAVLKGFDELPDVDPKIRKQLNQDLEINGIERLQQQLKELDPTYFSRVDIANPQRVIRALEICIGTGKPYSSFLNNKENSRNFVPILIGLTAERSLLYDRINNRVDLMFDAGLMEEAKKLYPFRSNNALMTVGYREIFDFIDGKISLANSIEEIKKNTRRFAKRQMVYFKKNSKIEWFEYNVARDKILNYIDSKILEIKNNTTS